MLESDQQASELADIQGRLILIKIGLLLLIALLGLRLWQLQVRDGHEYQEMAKDNRTRSIMLEPARGLLYDRHGQLLANNVPSFNLYVSLEDVNDRDALIEELIARLHFTEKDLVDKLSAQRRSATVKIKGGLSLKEAAIVESHRLTLPGTFIQPEYQRKYPIGGYASHVIGYVGEISEAKLKEEEYQGLHQGSMVGQYGVERTYDRALRGVSGRELLEVDALGHKKQSISVRKPSAGDDFYLTLDIRLQRLAEDLLEDEAGAVVALDPRTGGVLVLASRPSFDPTALSGGLPFAEWKALLNDARHPLTNRAIQGQYPPGSTFKIVMAAAVLGSQTAQGTDEFFCPGGFKFGRRTYRDWKRGGHGSVELIDALAQSCDVYFYKLGNRMGIETIASYSRQFGLGQKTGIDLPSERSGLVPSGEWKRRVKNEPWYPGETISVSIGQGFMTATPMQMAQVVAATAMNGRMITPRLVHAIRKRGTGMMEEVAPSSSRQLPIPPAVFQQIRQGLEAVVTKGTAKRSQSSLVSIAGKTGTAQVVALRSGPEKEIPKEFRDHAWFVAYAPVEEPTIVVVVLAEHMGHGGSAAAPIAKELIEAHVKFTSGAQMELEEQIESSGQEDGTEPSPEQPRERSNL
ncbi:MAG: penicillin-binding protein 2 [Nitrospirales bacterium]|nr:MAG: penicillin-binding protein 2 [Nitrospirales bacterium]